MIERSSFQVKLDDEHTVLIRHRVHDGTDHKGLKVLIGNLYRAMWRSWPSEYITDKNVLLLPPVDVLWGERGRGGPDSDIQGAIEAWCQNFPNVTDERVLDIAEKVRSVPYDLTPDDLHHLCKVFLEAHNGD